MLHIYTDGSCKGNPGSGGWSAIIMNQQEDKIIDVLSGTEQNTTNNRMELTAIIKAIEYVNRQPELATIYTDSAYAERSINEWMNRWYFNGWYNSKKKLVENVDLMKILHDYYAKEFVRFEVKKTSGHCGVLGNELADAKATGDQAKFKKIFKMLEERFAC